MQTKYNNPFTPTFGSVPIALAGRERLIDEVITGLENGVGDPNRASIFVGSRGSGKTVLLATIADIAQERGWIAVNVTSEHGMLEEILVQLHDAAEHVLSSTTRKRISGIQLAGTGVSLETVDEIATWRSKMTSAIKELNDNNIGLLITIDEVSADVDELKHVVNTFQHFVREKRDVALLLAGLPHKVSALISDESISFLRRSFRHSLDSIGEAEIAYATKKTVETGGRNIDDEALWEATKTSGGLAFLIQLIGYHMWKQNTENEIITIRDFNSAVKYIESDMDRMIFDPTIAELTEREKEFLIAMCIDDGPSRIATIADRMSIDANNASKIKKRLIESDVLVESGRGLVDYELPLMREHIRRNY